MILGLVLAAPLNIYAEQRKSESRPRLTIVACDRVGIPAEALIVAKEQSSRIMNKAGIDLIWIDALGNECAIPALDSYITIIIAPRAPLGWATQDAMGKASLPADIHCSVSAQRPCPRAYVFYDHVRTLIEYRQPPLPYEISLGIILGHTIAHEMGHLLIPGEAHGEGIMRPHWAFQECQYIFSGTLLFQKDHARIMQSQLRSN
jgi:hypothetical protein